MNIVQHLTEIVAALNELGVPHLVMGGRAVRYYGFNRETTDHDLQISAATGRQLTELLRNSTLFRGTDATHNATQQQGYPTQNLLVFGAAKFAPASSAKRSRLLRLARPIHLHNNTKTCGPRL